MEFGQVLVWTMLFAVLSLLGFPLASALFSRLPGRGAGFAPTLALCVVSLVAYWIGHLRFGPVALSAGLLVLASGAAVAVYRGVSLDWRAFGESMGVFGLAFCFMIAVRSVDPGIILHEGFLNYGMIRATLRTTQLPPEDFWFAGTTIRYHYGGHLVAALATMLTRTDPAVAFNLMMAGFYAMLVAGAYELAGAIAATNGRSRRVAGSLGAFFVGFAGNLLVPVVAVVHALPGPIREVVTPNIAGDLGRPAAESLMTGLGGFEYWDVLQTIPNTLNPFPLFAWFHGENHPHMNSAPFFLLVVAVCYAYYRTPEGERTERRLLAFGAFPLVAGFTVIADTWTAPTSIGLMWLALTFAPAAPVTVLPERVGAATASLPDVGRGWLQFEVRRVGVATAISALLAGLVVTASAPFVFLTASGGKESLALVPATSRSGLFGLLIVHGTFLAVFVVDFVERDRAMTVATRSLMDVWGLVAVLGVTYLGLWADAVGLLLFVPVIVAGWHVLRIDPKQFETLLVVAGTGLVLLAELVYVQNQEYYVSGRGNTVFRTYMQTWLLWGTAAGVILPRLVRPPDVSWRRLPRDRTVHTVFAVGLIVSTAAYGGVAGYNHFDRAFEEPGEGWEMARYVYDATEMETESNPPTLDGYLWTEVAYPYEAEAIRWLDRSVEGTPTIVTAPGGRWVFSSAAASLTGIPTVAGWGHELVYRDWDTYYDRVQDVQTIYTGPADRRVELLSKYDVQYVYVGPEEIQRYDIWDFSLLDGVSIAYRNDAVVIYEVDQGELGYTAPDVENRQYGAGELEMNDAVASYRDGRIVTDSVGALAWYGPYTTLPPGEYVATFRLSVNATGDGQPVATVDVARGAQWNGTADFRILADRSVGETDGIRTVSVPFTLQRPASDVEFRGMLTSGNGTVNLYDVTVERKASNESENGTRTG